jgi:hypothetical protein
MDRVAAPGRFNVREPFPVLLGLHVNEAQELGE